MQSPENNEKYTVPRCSSTVLQQIQSCVQKHHCCNQIPHAISSCRRNVAHVHRINGSLYFHTSSTRTRRGGSCLKEIYIETFLIYRTCMRRAPAKPVRACTLRNLCLVSHVTFEAPRHTSHLTVFNFTLRSSHCTLRSQHFTSHCTLKTPHFTLHTALFALQTSHFTVHTSRFTFHTSHWTLHALSHCTLHTPNFTLRTPHCTLHAPHFTLHSSHPTLHLI